MADHQHLIKQQLEDLVGASFLVEIVEGPRDGYLIKFADLKESKGPSVIVRPEGIKRHKIEVAYGKFSRETLIYLQEASSDHKALASMFLSKIIETNNLNPDLINQIISPSLMQPSIDFSIKLDENSSLGESFLLTCETTIAPIFFAFAELLGYEELEEPVDHFHESIMEGAVSLATIKKRERSKKNRALALLIHGQKCLACGLDPSEKYINENNILEVHHLQPLAQNSEPRPYNPALDLVPLCPNCHRTIHSFGTIPLTLNELKARLR